VSVIYLVLPLAVVFVLGAIGVFVWVVRSGQFDDTESPKYRALFDDEREGPDRLRANRVRRR